MFDRKESNLQSSYKEKRAQYKLMAISQLLHSPPQAGDLMGVLKELSEKSFYCDSLRKDFRFSVTTLYRAYLKAQGELSPQQILLRGERSDKHKLRALKEEHIQSLRRLAKQWPEWSIQLLYDNFKKQPSDKEGEVSDSKLPSYSTVLRYVKRHHILVPKPRQRISFYDRRRYEVPYVGQLWHLDFHHFSRAIPTETGEWKKPICLAVIDDHSRYLIDLQWSFEETTAVLCQLLQRAFLKVGLPRRIHSDCGAAMRGKEYLEGLASLGIEPARTNPYSPHENGKQESFWCPLESRMAQMIPRDYPLTLQKLNFITQAWVEDDYNQKSHQEIKDKPVDRFIQAPRILRTIDTSNQEQRQELKDAFRQTVVRQVHSAVGVVQVDNIRYEVPLEYRHLKSLTLRYSSWDLSTVGLVDPVTKKEICKLLPINLVSNAQGGRRETEQPQEEAPKQEGLAPLLQESIDKYLKKIDQKLFFL
jgi:transposase InsO family protein